MGRGSDRQLKYRRGMAATCCSCFAWHLPEETDGGHELETTDGYCSLGVSWPQQLGRVSVYVRESGRAVDEPDSGPKVEPRC